ncbi:MAG: RES family NAD+ phosphorylase [Sphingobium sp.]
MVIDYRGKLYRALNPVHAREPLSGEGARRYGGRFNPKGVSALYLSLSAVTALREANQVGNFQPTTLVCYEAEIEHLFDTRDEAALAAHGMDPAGLANPGWRDQMKSRNESDTQAFARRLIASNYSGILVRSFAPGAQASDLNIVLWNWADGPPSRLTPIDDEGQLSTYRA